MFVRGRDDTTGLPIGVLLTGQRFREDLCLDAAEAVEGRLRVACLDLTDNARPTSDNRIYCENRVPRINLDPLQSRGLPGRESANRGTMRCK